MSSIWYAVRGVFRNGRRTLSAVLGISLAIAFVSGTLIAVDSSVRATLSSLLSRVEYDFSGHVPPERMTEAVSELASIEGVEAISPYAWFELEVIANPAFSASTSGEGYAVDPSSLPAPFNRWQPAGGVSLSPGNAIISEDLSAFLGVGVGETIVIGCGESTACSLNVTVEDVLRSPDEDRFASSDFVLLHLDDLATYEDQGVIMPVTVVELQIWIDRDSILDPYDRQASEARLGQLAGRIEQVTNSIVGDRVRWTLASAEASNTAQRLIFLFVSLPVMFLGLYVGAVGLDLSYSERRRELAVLRSRGASRGQVVTTLIIEAIVAGLLAALIGLVAGLGLSRLLVESAALFGGGVASTGDVVLTPVTVTVTASLAAAFMFGLSYRSARRTAAIPLAETLQYYAPGEVEIPYRPKVDLVLVAIGAAIYALVPLSRVTTGGFFLFLLGVLPFILSPFVPALFLIGLTRLATRSTTRLYDAVARLVKPFSGNLYHIIRRNLTRNPRRSSNVAVILAVGIAFGVFALSLLASQIAWEERQLGASIGADLSLVPPLADAGFLQNLSATPGVETVTPVIWFPGAVGEVIGEVPILDTFALEPLTYFQASQPEGWYFGEGNRESAEAVLMTEGHILISLAFAQQYAYEVGDSLTIAADDLEGEGRALTVTVGGIVRGLPGTLSGGDFVRYDIPKGIYGSLQTFEPLLDHAPPGSTLDWLPPVSAEGGGTKMLVGLVPEANLGEVRARLLSLGATDVRIYDEERMLTSFSPVTRSLFGFLRLQVAFAVVILTAGLALVAYAASLEREVEFAGITARGAGGRQVAGLLLGEALALLVIGLSIGVGVGIISGYVATQTFLVGPPGTETLAPFFLEVPLDVVWFVLLALAMLLGAAVLLSWRLTRMNLARVLKLRGG